MLFIQHVYSGLIVEETFVTWAWAYVNTFLASAAQDRTKSQHKVLVSISQFCSCRRSFCPVKVIHEYINRTARWLSLITAVWSVYVFTYPLHILMIPSTLRNFFSPVLSSRLETNNSNCWWTCGGCERRNLSKYSRGKDSTSVLWRTHLQSRPLLVAKFSAFSSWLSEILVHCLSHLREWKLCWVYPWILCRYGNYSLVCVQLTWNHTTGAQQKPRRFSPFSNKPELRWSRSWADCLKVILKSRQPKMRNLKRR